MHIMKLHEVTGATGLSRSTVFRLELAGQFPRRRQLSARRIGWLEEEIADWVRARVPSLSLTRSA